MSVDTLLNILLPASWFDWIFFGSIFVLFFLSIANIISINPNVLVTIGILGTFLGIATGLNDFNTSDISASIPQLLKGLKLSFKTSLWGIIFSLILKTINSFLSTTEDTSDTPKNIQNMLFQINKGLSDLRIDIHHSYNEKLRIGNKQHTEFLSEFRNFTKTMAKQNSKALIEALNEIITDFNKNLTEQFGENFKQLNTAVHKLVDWQENYKTHIETLQNKMDLAHESILKTEEVLKQIALHIKEIPEYLSQFKDMLTALKRTTEEQKVYLTGIKELKDQAIQSFPIVEENIKKITTDFSEIAEEFSNKTKVNLNSQKKTFSSLEKGFSDLQISSEELNNQMQSTMKGILGKMSNEINNKIEEFDQKMQEELRRVIETMGKHLASINEKVAKDYTPIINHLQKILEGVSPR